MSKISHQTAVIHRHVNGICRCRGGERGKSPLSSIEASLDFVHSTDFMTANAGYVDARYVRYVDTAGRDRAGREIPVTPRFTGSTSIGDEAPLIGAWKARGWATYSYVGPITPLLCRARVWI